MFHEIKHVRQEAGAGRRRWFEADGVELVVWFDSGGRVAGFQICYHLDRRERALTWRAGAGFVHSAIDAGDDVPLKNLTPVLTLDNDVPWSDIARLFDEHSASLESPLRQLIQDKLAERAGADAPH